MDNFATDADTMIDDLYEGYQMRISFEYLQLSGNFIKLSCLNVKLSFIFLTLYNLALYILGDT